MTWLQLSHRKLWLPGRSPTQGIRGAIEHVVTEFPARVSCDSSLSHQNPTTQDFHTAALFHPSVSETKYQVPFPWRVRISAPHFICQPCFQVLPAVRWICVVQMIYIDCMRSIWTQTWWFYRKRWLWNLIRR